MVEKNRPGKNRPNKTHGAKLSDAPDEVMLPNTIKATEKTTGGESFLTKIKLAFLHFGDTFANFNQRQKIACIAMALFLVLGTGSLLYALMGNQPEPAPQIVVEPEPEPEPEPPKPTTEPSKLTGLEIKIIQNQLPVMGVMIENSPDARPQSGLREAGVIHEAIAEGGITRFLALYLDEMPSKIGPVRSARPYYLRWNLPYQAPYAHVGGSALALAEIPRLGIRDLDQFHNPGVFERVSYRYAPHNMYSNVKSLLKTAQSKGWKTSTFTSTPRKEDKPVTEPKASAINLNISYGQYNLVYNYSKKTNSYNRVMGGQKHTDEVTGKQLSPKVVIALVTDYGIDNNGVNSIYRTAGKGTVYIFQDGTVSKGTWRKKNDKAMIEYLNKKDEPIKLNAGQVWVTAMASEQQVSYE